MPRRKNKAVYVETVEGGYRVWCAVCEQEEHIPIPDSGMPPESLCAWLEAFYKRHRECTE